jgi:hypothetical protein
MILGTAAEAKAAQSGDRCFSFTLSSYYNIFGQESRAASPAFPPSRA